MCLRLPRVRSIRGRQSASAFRLFPAPNSPEKCVTSEVDAADGRLLQGMFAEVRLALAERRGLVVPALAVRKDGGVYKVLVPEGDRLAERIVDVGMKTESWTEIRSGLVEGEAVVLQLTRETRDGARFVVAAR
jgi:multidrug efflux pump subunit AcrA (membrane-fusion protein)